MYCVRTKERKRMVAIIVFIVTFFDSLMSKYR